MIEIFGNLFEQDVDMICITTNGGPLKKNGACAMGKGCAKEALSKWPGIDVLLGKYIKVGGNKIFNITPPLIQLMPYSYLVLSFPVKHLWYEKADLDLIRQSCKELNEIVVMHNEYDRINAYKSVVLPRPGCGAGQLDWEEEVKPILQEELLEDIFRVIDKKRGD